MSSRAEVDTRVIYSVCAAHYVDCVYNSLFAKALERVDRGDAQYVRDAFRTVLTHYMEGMRSAKYCDVTITRIYDVYLSVHPFVKQDRFESMMLAQFVPERTIESLNGTTRTEKLRSIVAKIASLTVNHVTTPDVVQMIIDDHNNPANVEALKREVYNYCVITREAIHTEYTRERAGVNNNVTIDASALTNATRRIQQLEDENERLGTDLERYRMALSGVWEQLKEHQTQLQMQMEKSEKLMEIIVRQRNQRGAPRVQVPSSQPAHTVPAVSARVTPRVEVDMPYVPFTPTQRTQPSPKTPPVSHVPIAIRTPNTQSGLQSSMAAITPIVSTPAVSAPTMNAPVVSTPVVSTPTMNVPVVSTPVVSTPVAIVPFNEYVDDYDEAIDNVLDSAEQLTSNTPPVQTTPNVSNDWFSTDE